MVEIKFSKKAKKSAWVHVVMMSLLIVVLHTYVIFCTDKAIWPGFIISFTGLMLVLSRWNWMRTANYIEIGDDVLMLFNGARTIAQLKRNEISRVEILNTGLVLHKGNEKTKILFRYMDEVSKILIIRVLGNENMNEVPHSVSIRNRCL